MPTQECTSQEWHQKPPALPLGGESGWLWQSRHTHVVSSKRDCLANPRQVTRQITRSRISSMRYVSHLEDRMEYDSMGAWSQDESDA